VLEFAFSLSRHCEERSDEAIQTFFLALDCFAVARNDETDISLQYYYPPRCATIWR